MDALSQSGQTACMTDDDQPRPGPGHADAGDDAAFVDATGLLCPLPVLRLRKRLSQVPAGRVVWLLADDPAARVDVPHFCAQAGHVLLATTADGPRLRFAVQKCG